MNVRIVKIKNLKLCETIWSEYDDRFIIVDKDKRDGLRFYNPDGSVLKLQTNKNKHDKTKTDSKPIAQTNNSS